MTPTPEPASKCDSCANNYYDKIPTVDWPRNPCLKCLFNAEMVTTNNFKPITPSKEYA